MHEDKDVIETNILCLNSARLYHCSYDLLEPGILSFRQILLENTVLKPTLPLPLWYCFTWSSLFACAVFSNSHHFLPSFSCWKSVATKLIFVSAHLTKSNKSTSSSTESTHSLGCYSSLPCRGAAPRSSLRTSCATGP